VKPMSIPASFGRRVFQATGDLGAVADALGRRSLDSAARMIGFEWHKNPDERAAQLGACVLAEPQLIAGAEPQTVYRRNPAGRRPGGEQGRLRATAGRGRSAQ